MDERYAAVDVLGKGLVIFSALSNLDLYGNIRRLTTINSCSHAGIVNVVKDAIKRFSRPIYMVRCCHFLVNPSPISCRLSVACILPVLSWRIV